MRSESLSDVLEDAWELEEYLEAETDTGPGKFPRSNIERIVSFLEDLQENE